MTLACDRPRALLSDHLRIPCAEALATVSDSGITRVILTSSVRFGKQQNDIRIFKNIKEIVMAFKYLNIIKSIELSEIRQENKNKKNKSSMDTYFLSVASILLFISLILLFIYKYYGEHGFIFALTITSLSGCYLTLLLMPFIKIYTNKSKIKNQ